MLADVQCQSTTIPSSTEQIASLKVDTGFYDEFLNRIITDRCNYASKKEKGLFESRC